jgi:hypothetical protein
MDFPAGLLQTISAFVIFALGYLALLLSIVVCFVIATCIYKGGSLALAYTVRSASLDHDVVTMTQPGPRA